MQAPWTHEYSRNFVNQILGNWWPDGTYKVWRTLPFLMVRMHFLRRINWSAINTTFARWMTCTPRSALHVHNSLIIHLSVAKLGIQCLNKLKRNEEWLPGFETQHCIWKNTDDSLIGMNMTVQFWIQIICCIWGFHWVFDLSQQIGRYSPAGFSRRYHLRTWLTPRCVHMLHASSTSSWLDTFRGDTIWAQGYCI